MKSDIINIYNLDKYSQPNIYNKIDNNNIVIYSLLSLIILILSYKTNKFSYVFIGICILAITSFYLQKISYSNYHYNLKETEKYIKELNINPELLLTRDKYLIQLLYSMRFLKLTVPKYFKNLILYIEDFIVTFETLKQNVDNIYLKETDLIKKISLNKIQRSIFINDLRDKLERILKYIQTFIHILPNSTNYLDAYYEFNQLLRSHLSRYYNRILADSNFDNHTSNYLLIRSSEDKYDFIL